MPCWRDVLEEGYGVIGKMKKTSIGGFFLMVEWTTTA